MSETFKNFRYALVGMLLLFCAAVQAQTISGNVKDGNGEPIIGATVMEQGTQNGTVTDFDGNFTLKLQKGGNLNISYVGMKSQVIKTAGKSSVNVTLEDDNTTLNDLVVVGYGTMKKSDLTGSVSSVNTEQLNAKGAASVMGNLQGATPGVNISQTSGRAGGDFNIEIRGKSSINSDTKPIFVVDGVICDDINWLNPQDIEKIDVLKDASSTAIYGSRATAGVVMVTTKGGLNVKKEAKATISYDGYYGWTKAVRMPDFMNAEQFARWRLLEYTKRQSVGPDGNPANPYTMVDQAMVDTELLKMADGSGYLIPNMLKRGEEYNWPDIVTKGGSQQNHYLAVNGTSTNVAYHFGIGYNREQGIYEADKREQISFKGSVDAQINKYLSAGFTANLARINQNYAADGAVEEAYRMNPFVKPYYTSNIYGDDGTLLHKEGETIHRPAQASDLGTAGGAQFSGNSVNPLDLMRNVDKERRTWRALGNFYLEVKPFKGLSFKSTFSPNFTYYRHGQYYGYNDTNTGETTHFWDDRASGSELYTEETAMWTSYEKFQWTWDNVVTYNTRFNDKHSLNVMGLYSSQKETLEKNGLQYKGVIQGTQWYNTKNGEYDATESDGTSYGENSMTSWAMRANYGYMDRYLLTATVRWDGSSKFTKDNRWGCFPSFAFAWRASEEEFIKKIDWISNLKLRVSYGVTGNNSGVGNYATVSGLSGTQAFYPFGSTYYTGVRASGVVDKEIKWEKSHEFNLGLDFGFWNNRLNGSIDWYTKKSKDLLATVSLPTETGWTSGIYTNIGEVRNRGIELSLTGILIQNKDWNWSVTTNWAHNKNEVLKLTGEVDAQTGKSAPITSGKPTGNYFVGESVNNVYTYEIGGIASDRDMVIPDNEMTKKAGLTPGSTMKEYDYYYATQGVKEGQVYLVDTNNDGEINANDRKVFSCDPDWTGSVTTNLSYKNWDFGMSLYMRFGGYTYANFMTDKPFFEYADRGMQHFNMDYYIPAGTLIGYEGMNADGTIINPVYQQTTHYGEYPFPADQKAGIGPWADYYYEARACVKTDYMKCKNITLGYTFPKQWLSSWGCSHLRLYFTVTNPFVFTGYKGYDPEWASAAGTQDGPSTVSYQIGASIKF